MSHKKIPKKIYLPGKGRPRNLIKIEGQSFETCPCCHAAWVGGRPWAGDSLTTQEVAELLGVTRSAILQRLMRGTLQGYQDNHGNWVIPYFLVK